jgi:CHAT domain-containing protein
LVVSLWQVPDQSTAELMTALYGRLDQGETKAEALRRAKLHLLTAGGRTAAPFYWAPFVLVGSRG